MDLDVETLQREGARVLSLRGEIDVYTAPRLRQAIVDQVEQGLTHLIVDMTAVECLDSTGLGVLVEGLKRVRSRDGIMSLVAIHEKILKIFDITGLNKAFPMYRTVDEALAHPSGD